MSARDLERPDEGELEIDSSDLQQTVPAAPAVLSQAISHALVGQTLRETYRILAVHEQGGMGTVFRGEHQRLRRPVAIKVLARHLVDEPAALLRFRSEAEIVSQLHHPHVVHILDYDTTEHGDPYIVMELLAGETLSRRLSREQVLGLREIVQVVSQAAGGLLVAHAAGIVHRDLKPDNVFLLDMQDGSIFVKLLDFGISKRTAAHARVTGEFEVLGTPDYMAPEQILNSAQADHRADQWSLAAITYEMLAGRIPFYSSNVGRTLTKVLNDDPPPLSDMVPGIAPAIVEVVRRGLAKNPVDRFPMITDYADALARAASFSSSSSLSPWSDEQATDGQPSRTPPLGEMKAIEPPPSSAAPLSSDESGWAMSSLLDSENRLPLPTLADHPPPDSSALWPHSLAHTVRTTASPADSSMHPSPELDRRLKPTPRSNRVPSINARLRRSDPPLPYSSDLPPESLRAPRVPNIALGPQPAPHHASRASNAVTEPPFTEPPFTSEEPPPPIPSRKRARRMDPQTEAALTRLGAVLDEIRQAVTFGEGKRALTKARQAVQITRSERQPEVRELLSSATALLQPILLRALGGSKRRVSIVGTGALDGNVVSPDHVFLLSRVDGTATIEELLDTSPLSAPETLGILLDVRDQGCLGFE